jgi:hypothetical protein
VIEDPPPRADAEAELEPYNHSMRLDHKVASIASFLFFAGGQIISGRFRRALALWGLLIVVIVGGFGLTFVLTEPGSTAQIAGIVVTLAAMFCLWLYQLWDAAFGP